MAEAHTALDTLVPQDPKDGEGNHIVTSGNGPLPLNLDSIDCKWAEWGPCEDIKCGI